MFALIIRQLSKQQCARIGYSNLQFNYFTQRDNIFFKKIVSHSYFPATYTNKTVSAILASCKTMYPLGFYI